MSDKRSEIERFKRQSRSFSLSLQGFSRKATCKADAREYTDIDWVPLSLAATTAEFNETTLPLVQSHATLARLRSGARENKAQEKKAVKEMLAAREQIYLNWLGQYAYFYVGPPRYEPLPAMLGVWVMMNERDEQLRWLAGYKTTDQAERSVLEEFSTEHLGTGVKVWTVTKSEKQREPVNGRLGYAWRSEELETDLSLQMVCDLAWIKEVMPRADEFVRALRLVPSSAAGGGSGRPCSS